MDTINATNWTQGTVFIEILDKWEVVNTLICDIEHSRIIREIIESQDYRDEKGTSTLPNLRLMINGKEYLMNTTTGYISEKYSAVLSAENLGVIMSVINSMLSTN